MRLHTVLLVAYAAILCLCAACLHRTCGHSTSRLAPIYSLVEQGTFYIDNAPYRTQDKVYIDGRYYSHQPPLQAVAGALVYYPLRLAGLRLERSESGPAYTLVTFALNGLSSLVAVVFFFLSLKRT